MAISTLIIDVSFKIITGWLDGNKEYALVEIKIFDLEPEWHLFEVNNYDANL